MRTLFRTLVAASLLLVVAPSPASELPPEGDPLVVNSAGFLAYHPDLRFRQLGLEAWEQGRHDEAMTYFRRAARFGDKPAQGMVAEMLWNGEGVAQDRPLAYAWMDLAAERGYRRMLIRREVFWEALGEDERARAISEGERLYAEYGDAAAKPRLEARLRQGRRNATGSRTGMTGNLRITIPTPSGEVTIDGSQYFDAKYWDPDEYWAWQDHSWTAPVRGRVDIGPMRIDAPSSGPADEDE